MATLRWAAESPDEFDRVACDWLMAVTDKAGPTGRRFVRPAGLEIGHTYLPRTDHQRALDLLDEMERAGDGFRREEPKHRVVKAVLDALRTTGKSLPEGSETDHAVRDR